MKLQMIAAHSFFNYLYVHTIYSRLVPDYIVRWQFLMPAEVYNGPIWLFAKELLAYDDFICWNILFFSAISL